MNAIASPAGRWRAAPRLALCLLVAAGACRHAPAHAQLQAQAQGRADSGAAPHRSAMVIGSGTLRTEARRVTGFRAVHLRGPMNLVLRQGPREAVEVRADDNLLALIDTTVAQRGGLPTLEIGSPSGTSWSTRSEMTVTVELIELAALTISGSGDTVCDRLHAGALELVLSGSGNVRFDQLRGDALRITLSGSGDLQAHGEAARVDLFVRGSGTARLGTLRAGDVAVRLAGSGDASVHASRTLVIDIDGSGDVDHAGTASVRQSVRGSGSVTRAAEAQRPAR